MSHRSRVTEQSGILPATTYGQWPQLSKVSRLPAEKMSTASHRLSMTSNSSSGRRSSTSLEGLSVSYTARPSGIPRPTKTTASTRLNTVASSRPSTVYTYKTKPVTNITGIATRTTIQNRSKDRIIPSNNTPRIVTDDDMLSLEQDIPSLDMDHDTVFGIAIPQKQLSPQTNLPPRLIPELQALAATAQRRPTPAMSTISTVSSPSTQFTTSPSPWSASTTATTPTSWSSASPSLVQPIRSQSINKRSQTVPIPSAMRTKLPKLPVLQESAVSSASSSKANIQSEEVHTPKKSKKRTPINSPAPTPPPRTSSVKRNRSRSNSKNEEPQTLAPLLALPVPREPDVSPILKHTEEIASRQKQPTAAHALADHHNKLQSAINAMPSRPSKGGTDDLSLRIPHRINDYQNQSNEQARKLLDAAPIEALPQAMSRPSLQLNTPSEPEPEPAMPTTPSRSRLAKFSKFALFGKSSKSAPVDESSPQRRKLQRKGPAAGTGHEGYGKFAKRERRVSSDGNITGTESETSIVSTKRRPMRSSSRKDSSNSVRQNNASQSDLDEFAASRMKPVVILGGSLKLTGGLQSHPPGNVISDINPTIDNDREPSERLSSTAKDRQPSVTSSGPLMRESRLIFHLDSLDAHDPPQPVPIYSSNFERISGGRTPQFTNVNVNSSQPYQSGYNTSQSSIAATSVAATDTSNDLYKVDSHSSEKRKKKGRRLNWGFFKRREVVPETHQPRTLSRTTTPQMAVRISTVQPPRPMPYYAMLESENEISTTIGDFLTEAARAIPMDDDLPVSPSDEFDTEPEVPIRRGSVLLPTAPQLNRETASTRKLNSNVIEATVQSPESGSLSTQPVAKQRQPRLVQVGRIPKVVPTSQSTSSTQSSFSRPRQPNLPKGVDKTYPMPIKSVPRPLAINTNLPPSHLSNYRDTNKASSAPVQPSTDVPTFRSQTLDQEVTRVRDRYSTTSSSSDGVQSVMGPPLLPAPEFPIRSLRNTVTEDDIWDEYDDFIDHVISPPRLKKSRTRITDEDKLPSTLSHAHEELFQKPLSIRQATKGLAVDTSLAPPKLFFKSSLSPSDHDADQDLRLRRSRIISALHSSMDPSSPFSIGDYLAELGEPKRNSTRTSGRLSDSTFDRGSLQSPQTVTTPSDLPTAKTEYRHYENALHMDEIERSKDPVKYAERSYASLMVSRWLSFGRVLFSPAHADIQKQAERHVLVIDGLGNEDWSIYCAVNYTSEQAYIYDLKETGHTRSSTSPSKAAHTPQNFRRRELASFHDVFKFPDNFFSVIVLRFPPVMAESKLKNIISECRRVLAPGGYMELMLLDLDIVNMGVLTRRAMRELKIKIAMHNREVSLKPVIDNVQSVLGEKGFSKLSKCVVGVPVVGRPPGAESPTSSRSSATSDRFRRSPTAGPRPFDGLEPHKYHNFSLNDLVADHSDNADARIGRMVSRTARSWWQHCFEATIISDGDLAKSILADKQVLSECKSRASSFKLLIAYTQKPTTSAVSMKRRTMSEPVIATLATAGTP